MSSLEAALEAALYKYAKQYNRLPTSTMLMRQTNCRYIEARRFEIKKKNNSQFTVDTILASKQNKIEKQEEEKNKDTTSSMIEEQLIAFGYDTIEIKNVLPFINNKNDINAIISSIDKQRETKSFRKPSNESSDEIKEEESSSSKIKEQLIAFGYDEIEINDAFKFVNDKNDINGIISYIDTQRETKENEDILNYKNNDNENETKEIPFIDCYHLFNKLQRTFCSITIDIQSVDDYNKSHIKNALNIPINSQNMIEIINQYQTKNSKDSITEIFVYTNNINNDTVWNHISLMKDIMIKHKICENHQLFVLDDNYNIFAKKFPFLCENNKDKQRKDDEYKLENKQQRRRRIINMHKGLYPNHIINDKLFLGDKNSALSQKVITDLGITHIINCTPSPPPNYQRNFTSNGYIKNLFENDKNMNIKYMRIAIDDSRLQDIKTHFIKSHEFINKALQNDNNKILIHCFAGVSRSATIIISYLIKFKNMSLNEAISFTKERRDVVNPNVGFIQQLKKYEKEIN